MIAPRLHTASEYAEMVRYRAIIDESCRILGCSRDDFVRMADGLIRSNQMLRGEIPIDEASLPKRWRRSFKRMRQRP